MLFWLAAGCGKSGANDAPSASSASARPASTPAPAESSRAALATAAPADVDVAALKKKLACENAARRQACRLLNEFGEAARFVPQIPSGEGRWIGTAYTLAKGPEKSDLILLSAVQAPTSTVPAGELAMRIGIGPMPDDKRDHGLKLASALARGDTAPKTNQAAPYVKSWKATDPKGTMSTSGNSIRLVSEEMFLRQNSAKKVLLIRLKAEEATLAELWAAAW
jgi:hypothetical protein